MSLDSDVVRLAPVTASAQSGEIQVKSRPITVSIYPSTGSSLTEANSCDLERKNAAGNWMPVYDSNGQVRLGSGRTEVTIISGGIYRISKGVTTELVGVAEAMAPNGV